MVALEGPTSPGEEAQPKWRSLYKPARRWLTCSKDSCMGFYLSSQLCCPKHLPILWGSGDSCPLFYGVSLFGSMFLPEHFVWQSRGDLLNDIFLWFKLREGSQGQVPIVKLYPEPIKDGCVRERWRVAISIMLLLLSKMIKARILILIITCRT